MFFTIESIKSFVVDLDSFLPNPKSLQYILEVLKAHNAVYVSGNRSADFSLVAVDQNKIFRAQSDMETWFIKDVIRRAMNTCDMSRRDTVFVSMDHERPMQAAQELLLGTMLCPHNKTFDQNKISIYQNLPDYIVQTAEEMELVLDGQRAGHFAETIATENQLHPIPLKTKQIYYFEIAPTDGVQVLFSGRYFKVEDARHHLHPLSLRIINAKKYPERHLMTFSGIFAHLIMWKTKGEFDLVIGVPPKPNQPDRIGLFAGEVHKHSILKNAGIGDRTASGALTCIRDYGSLKASGGAIQRAEAIKGALRADKLVRNKRIVLLDDVYATGSTMNECITTLMNAGAANVLPVALAYHPKHSISLEKLDDSLPLCQCGGKLVPRFNKNSGGVFYGCENFLQSGSHSTHTFERVQRLRLQKSESKIMTLDDELIDWDTLF